MSIRERLSGNEAIACAMRQIDPDVFAAFPITPSTEIPQYFAQYVADGRVSTEFIPVESEHSSLSACIGAQAAGVRHGRAGHAGEDHRGQHVGVPQAAGHPADHLLAEAEDLVGHAAVVHDVAGQDEEGNGNQREGVGPGKEPLGAGGEGHIGGEHTQHGDGAGQAHRNTDGNAHGQHDDQKHHHDKGGLNGK